MDSSCGSILWSSMRRLQHNGKWLILVQWLKDKTGELTKQDLQASPLTNLDHGM